MTGSRPPRSTTRRAPSRAPATPARTASRSSSRRRTSKRSGTRSRRGRAARGLGARDTLRLEAGMNLYGQDMDENVTPLEAGLGMDRRPDASDARLRRRGARLAQRTARKALVGLCCTERGGGVLRARSEGRHATHGARRDHQRHVFPTLQEARSRFARVPTARAPRRHRARDVRDKHLPRAWSNRRSCATASAASTERRHPFPIEPHA